MTTEVVALAGGILFLLVAIVGGGFAIREISVPPVPHWARAAAAVFGILLLLPFILTLIRGDTTESTTPSPDAGYANPRPRQGSGGIEIDAEPATTEDGIRITNFSISVRNNPPRVGDTLTVDYSLTNVGTEPVQLEYTFVGVRDPADENKDTEDENEGRTMAVGETIDASGRVFLDTAGHWMAFPCYLLSGDRYCPDEWKAFDFIVA